MNKKEREKFSEALDEYVETVEWPDDDDDGQILVLYWHPHADEQVVHYVEATPTKGIFEVRAGRYEAQRADLDLVLKEPPDFKYPPVYYEMFDSEKDMVVFLLSGVPVGTQFAVYPREDADIEWEILG